MGRIWAALSFIILIALVSNVQGNQGLDFERLRLCDPAVPIEPDEKKNLIERLRISKAGQTLVQDFEKLYGGLDKLVLQWDAVSYSQIISKKERKRSPAVNTNKPNVDFVCIHLARKLPKIEHLADLSHELVHATQLERSVLLGEVEDVDQFVKARIKSKGGEAEAFAMECVVKRELLGRWDSLCAPYAKDESAQTVDVGRVIRDLYNGQLSASLTGEPYPVMLARQFKAILRRPKR